MSTLRTGIVEAFRREGVRCTSQRYAILEYLRQTRTHPTAEEIHQAINRKDPRASLATVYKALHAMARAGLIQELNLGGNAVRFEARAESHHHFICERCGRMEDIPWFKVPQGTLRASIGGRKARTCEVVVKGICSSCA